MTGKAVNHHSEFQMVNTQSLSYAPAGLVSRENIIFSVSSTLVSSTPIRGRNSGSCKFIHISLPLHIPEKIINWDGWGWEDLLPLPAQYSPPNSPLSPSSYVGVSLTSAMMNPFLSQDQSPRLEEKLPVTLTSLASSSSPPPT